MPTVWVSAIFNMLVKALAVLGVPFWKQNKIRSVCPATNLWKREYANETYAVDGVAWISVGGQRVRGPRYLTLTVIGEQSFKFRSDGGVTSWIGGAHGSPNTEAQQNQPQHFGGENVFSGPQSKVKWWCLQFFSLLLRNRSVFCLVFYFFFWKGQRRERSNKTQG